MRVSDLLGSIRALALSLEPALAQLVACNTKGLPEVRGGDHLRLMIRTEHIPEPKEEKPSA